MAWIPQTQRSHFEYGAGSWSQYYWDHNNNPGATFQLCLANCTTFAYGRPLENGWSAPVTQFRNANNWHNYVNTADGWVLLSYSSGMQLLAGDIVEWQAQHVAVVEEDGTNPHVGASWYTDDNGHAYGSRTAAVIGGSTMQDVSNWCVANYPNRFYHYVLLSQENANAGGGAAPKYVLRYQGTQPDPPVPPTADITEIVLSGKIVKERKGVNINVRIYKPE